MRKKFVPTIFLLALICNIPKLVSAQSSSIDTIVVNFSSDTDKVSQKITPTLDLNKLRQSAREDSIRIIQMANQKTADKQKELEQLREKRLKEKEEKEKRLKDIADKRKKEKEAREKAFAEKKAKQEALDAKKKEEKKLAKQKVKEKKKAKQEKKKEVKQEETNISSEKISKLTSDPIDTTKTVPLGGKTTNKKETDTTPKIPNDVDQKDNIYGTVRLAYDEQAASFLLSIPTETKMHYHKDHSEQILLIEGQGMILMGYKTIKLKKNELIFITKGTPHKIINSGRGKLKVLSIQAPFYDGSDKIILE